MFILDKNFQENFHAKCKARAYAGDGKDDFVPNLPHPRMAYRLEYALNLVGLTYSQSGDEVEQAYSGRFPRDPQRVDRNRPQS